MFSKENTKICFYLHMHIKCAEHDERSVTLAGGHVSLMGDGSAWMLLSYKPSEVQEPPEACYSQLMHSPNLPLRFSSLCHALPLCLFPSLSFLSSPFSMSCCPLHLSNPLPHSEVLTTLLHRALFLPLTLSHVHTHSRTDTQKLWQLPQQRATSPTLQRGSVQVLLACPDPHLDIALSMLTAKS